jgi:uncharacterized protein (DUF1684 family)
MFRTRILRLPVALAATLTLGAALAPTQAAAPAAAVDSAAEQAGVLQWREQRFSSLTSDTGWLTLAGLFWLREGRNSFGSSSGNDLVLNTPALANTAGVFELTGRTVRFLAQSAGGVTLAGAPAGDVVLKTDASSDPTILASGTLRFFVIERGGKFAVRVRDLNNPRRREFRGLQYFPISSSWVVTAHFVPYPAGRRIKIINILGMEEEDVSPGAVVFTKDGREWRLDTVQEGPGEQELFIMFADGTSGQETYGGGRFLYIPLPSANTALLDFNKAFNPPCALNDFATCPLPPPQNRLQLRVEAGELKYAGGPEHSL